MNILLINHYAGSPDMGMEFRPYYFAKEWTKTGHHVRIIGASYSHLRVKNPEVKKDFQKETIDGISYYWVKTGQYNGNGIKRALTMFQFVGKIWLAARKIAEKWKPDVVITSSTYPLDTYVGQRIVRFSGARLIHEVHDMWPATLVEVGGMSKYHPFILLLQLAENSAYKNSEYVVSLLPLAKKYMVRHGMDASKFVEIPNGVILEDWMKPWELPVNQKELLENLRREGKFIIGYFGGHALSNALDVLLDVAKKEKEKDICFVLAGNGAEKQRLMRRTEEEQIKNVYFIEPVSKKAIPTLLSYFDCIYMGMWDSPLYRFGICLNKMYDSMMAGKPILCAVNTPVCPVETYQCGIMVKGTDTDEIVKAAERFFQMSEDERRSMGEAGRQAALKYFTYDMLAARVEKLFKTF